MGPFFVCLYASWLAERSLFGSQAAASSAIPQVRHIPLDLAYSIKFFVCTKKVRIRLREPIANAFLDFLRTIYVFARMNLMLKRVGNVYDGMCGPLLLK